MTELVYHVATSLDGFICDRNGGTSGFLPEGDHIPDFLNSIYEYSAVLMGKRTYEYGYQFGLKPGEQGYKGLKHYIFSRSLDFPSNDGVELVNTDAIAFIAELKKQKAKPIWLCGGGELAASLLKNRLIDKLILKVNPILINDGIPMFGSAREKIGLVLIDFRKYDSGVLKPTYRIEYF
jgi:dihydrofolate reductase